MHEPLAQLLERTFSATEREVIYRLIHGCGEVRRFATDPARRMRGETSFLACGTRATPWLVWDV